MLPVRTGQPVPLVILIHGGSFASGDKSEEDVTTAEKALLKQGSAVASINYRLAGEALFPSAGQDVKAATRWLRAHAAMYGLDGTRFGAWGFGGGGYLASLLGVTGGQSTVFDNPDLGNGGVSSAVQAVVAWSAQANFLTLDQQTALATGCAGAGFSHAAADSPESVWLGAPVGQTQISAAADLTGYAAHAPAGSVPPFLLGHGSNDCVVPAGQAMALSDVIRSGGGKAQVILVPGAGHDGNAPALRAVLMPASTSFLGGLLTPSETAPSSPSAGSLASPSLPSTPAAPPGNPRPSVPVAPNTTGTTATSVSPAGPPTTAPSVTSSGS